MSINAIGTLFRIVMIFLTLICFWYVSVSLIYFGFTLLTSFEFSVQNSFILFGVFILFRMFYPKNVFL